MGNVGSFFPIFLVGCVVIVYLLCYIDKMVEPKTSYEKWLEEELARNPGYIDWLKCANCGRDYRLGLKVLRKIIKEGEQN